MDFFQQFQKHENPFNAAKKPRFEPASADDQLTDWWLIKIFAIWFVEIDYQNQAREHTKIKAENKGSLKVKRQ